MRNIALSRSILVFWDELVFLEAALLASDKTKHLAAPVSAELDAFTKAQERDRNTRRSVMQAMARAAVADSELDDGIREVHANALHLVKQNRKKREFTTLFSETISSVIRYALKRQIEVAKELLTKLAVKIYKDSFRDTQIGILQPLIGKGEATLKEREVAELDRHNARNEIDDWKQDVNAVRLAVYGDLLNVAAKNDRKRSWANLFFPAASSRVRNDEPEPSGNGNGGPSGTGE